MCICIRAIIIADSLSHQSLHLPHGPVPALDLPRRPAAKHRLQTSHSPLTTPHASDAASLIGARGKWSLANRYPKSPTSIVPCAPPSRSCSDARPVSVAMVALAAKSSRSLRARSSQGVLSTP